MSALAEALGRAAVAMPGGRIRIRKQQDYGAGMTETLFVVYGGRETRVGFLAPAKYADMGPFEMIHLECALREECAARDWTWSMEAGGWEAAGRTFATVMRSGPPATHHHPVMADSLALALLLALLAAAEAEGGRG